MRTSFIGGRRFLSHKTVQRRVVAAFALAHVVIGSASAANLLDTSFDPGSGASGVITAIAHQTDGRILIAGAFTEFNAIPRNRIARLNLDGSLDSSFNPAAGADDTVNAMAIQPDGRIVI